jgi:hypothetical protein
MDEAMAKKTTTKKRPAKKKATNPAAPTKKPTPVNRPY